MLYNLIDVRKDESKIKELNFYYNVLIIFLFSLTAYSFVYTLNPVNLNKSKARVNWLTIGLISSLISGGIAYKKLPEIERKVAEIEDDSKVFEQNNRQLALSFANEYQQQQYSNLLNPPQPQQQSPLMNSLMEQIMSIPIVGEKSSESQETPSQTNFNSSQNQVQTITLNDQNYEATGTNFEVTFQNDSNLNYFDWNNFKNKDEFPNIAVLGKPGSGKSTLGQWLGAMLGGLTIAVAPHWKQGDFPTADIICGRGRNYGDDIKTEPIGENFNDILNGRINVSCVGMVKAIHQVMTYRYQLDDYENPKVNPPITLILDEYNSYACKKGLSEYMGELLREARKVNIRLIFLCHQFNVKALGIEGQGDIRKSINQINLTVHAKEVALTNLNKAKTNSKDFEYWTEVTNTLSNNNRACLVDNDIAIVPDLSTWLAQPNPNQRVLGISQISPSFPTVETLETPINQSFSYDDESIYDLVDIEEKKHQIRQLMIQGKGKSEIIKTVWNVSGGRGYQRAKQEYEQIMEG